MKNTEKKSPIAKKDVKTTVKTKTAAKEPVVKEEKACCCGKKNMLDAYLDVLAEYMKFSGRLSRRGYWCFVLFNSIFALLCLLLDAFLLTSGILFLTYGLLTIVPSYAAVARRLHDINRSMWWGMLPLLVIPLVLQLTGHFRTALLGWWPGLSAVFLIVTYIALVMCFMLCYFLLRKGCDGANKYGEKPCC